MEREKSKVVMMCKKVQQSQGLQFCEFTSTQLSNQKDSDCSSKGGELDPEHVSSTRATSFRVAGENATVAEAGSSSWI